MKIYHYSKDNGEFIFKTNSRKDPMEKDKYLLPAFATFSKPPQTQEGEKAVFENDQWVIKKDNRGKYYKKLTGDQIEITELGQELPNPEEYTKNPPANDLIKPQFDDTSGNWKEAAALFKGFRVVSAEGVRMIARTKREKLGEQKLQTDCLEAIALGNPIPESWFNFIKQKNELEQEAADFIANNF